jgi:hypothetical protein
MQPFAFMRFYRDLRGQDDTFELLTRLSWEAMQRRDDGIRKIPRPIELPDGTAKYAADTELWKVQAISSDIQRETLTASVFAGSIMLILDDLVQNLAARLGLRPLGIDLKVGPHVKGVALSTILKATTNNIRHYEEWATKLPAKHTAEVRTSFKAAFASLDPLQALGIAGDPVRTNVAGDVLRRLTFGSYGLLREQLLRIPEELASQCPDLEVARLQSLVIMKNLDDAGRDPRSQSS